MNIKSDHAIICAFVLVAGTATYAAFDKRINQGIEYLTNNGFTDINEDTSEPTQPCAEASYSKDYVAMKDGEQKRITVCFDSINGAYTYKI